MFCRDFCGNVAARDDGKRGTERVSNDRSESDNVYILLIKGEVILAGKMRAAPTHVGSSQHNCSDLTSVAPLP